jgi:hypothetical protein
MNTKPLGHKSYGSIPHLSCSKLGPGDYHCHIGQERIATIKTRDKNDVVIVQEKLDGGNVGIAKINGCILAITRAGYLTSDSTYETHHHFNEWVKANCRRFAELLFDGERLCGEWLLHAVGTRYELPHEPFVAFDIMVKDKRKTYAELVHRTSEYGIITPNTIHVGNAISVPDAMSVLGNGKHGAIDKVEGLIYRVERYAKVDFLAKYVRHDKDNGCYFPERTGNGLVWNTF